MHNDEFQLTHFKPCYYGETWVDFLTWETMEDAKNVDEASCTDALVYYFLPTRKAVKFNFLL